MGEKAEQTDLKSYTTETVVHRLATDSQTEILPNCVDLTYTSTAPMHPTMAVSDFPKPRTRVRCYWKGCSFRGKGQESAQEHMTHHRKCPKNDCESQFDEEKEKRRHVWTKHVHWAISVDYPKINGQCDLCGKVYKRGDYVIRHKREEHEGKKRGEK